MFGPHHFFELSPLYLAQAALTIWMLVDASRRGVEFYWFWIILFFQPLGAWGYFFAYKVKDFTRGGLSTGWLSNLFTRRPSLEELRYRAEHSPTPALRLELAQRLLEEGEYEEAEPHLKAVLAREPDLGTALFALAECYRLRGQQAEAVPVYLKLLSLRPNWRDYQAWHILIETYQKMGDHPNAVAQAVKLTQAAPSLEHQCLLARCHDEAGDPAAGCQVLEKALEAYRFNPQPTRADRRWVGRAKKLLNELRP